MTDIVERLRGSDAGRREMLEAADEIEFLQAKLAKLEELLGALVNRAGPERMDSVARSLGGGRK